MDQMEAKGRMIQGSQSCCCWCRSELYSPRLWEKSHKLLEAGRGRQGLTLVAMLQIATAGNKLVLILMENDRDGVSGDEKEEKREG
jgi:hypothetical protein